MIRILVFLCLLAFNAARALESPHGPLTLDCQTCHTTDNWTKMKTDSAFSHNAMTNFPLVGRHRGVSCLACHTDHKFKTTSAACLDCHTDIHRGQFSANCADCHTPNQWVDEPNFRKAHETTRFPLAGVHSAVDCQSCHANGQYAALSTACISCHADNFATAQSPDHAAAGFSQNCLECHLVEHRALERPRVPAFAGLPLTGGHALTDCQACHSAGFVNTSSACVECHQPDYASAQNPTHEAAAFPSTCESCHTTTAWRPAEFINHNQTQFPLTGAHALTECAQCHVGGQYTGTATQCVGCHEPDFTATANPEHDSPAFNTSCESCHTTSAWRPATFTTHDLTAFPLTGAHLQTDCAQCHAGNQYTGTPTDCWSCHEEQYNGTTDPNHVAAGYSQNCAACHNTGDWNDATFDHYVTTFPLTGRHIETECLDCHVGGVYTGTPTDCWSCHESRYNEQSDHVQNSFPHDCAVCHNTFSWEQATFDHNTFDFRLTGSHIQVKCLDCHVGGVYDGTPTDCWSCHQDDYNEQSDHVQNNFPHDCAVCHNTVDWEQATFNHSNTEFPLTGAHIEVDCQQCHVGGVYDGTPTDCWSCHEEDYNEADDHLSENFPHDCLQCHNTNDWDSDFNHSTTAFPLTGAHITTACLACHVGGQFENTPTECSFCHQTDFNAASNPDHNEGYPQECLECHTTSNWSSNFDHDDDHFPIYSGRHNNEWNLCIDCHTTAGNFTLFSCIDCHEHDDPNDLADEHDDEDVEGYTYTPTSCYACHPDGNERGSSTPDHRRATPRRVEVQK
ncbi:MAG: hypothetical protein IPG71_05020 [bacterium]|nr:hypothetical protein [bacterium]